MTERHVDRLHPRITAVDLKTGVLTPFLFKWLIALWERTGGPSDFVDEEEADEYDTNIIDTHVIALTNRIKSLEMEMDIGRSDYAYQKFFKSRELSINYTTKYDEILICMAAITVTLNPYAKINERVYIKRTNGKVTIVGTIDNKTNLIINHDNASVTLVKTQTGWWIL